MVVWEVEKNEKWLLLFTFPLYDISLTKQFTLYIKIVRD